MNYIQNFFHFYSTTESFELHRKQGLISPDAICFLEETSQIYTQGAFFGICKERFEKLEQLVLAHEAAINNILGIEGPSVNDGIVNNIADLVNFLDGFTDKDNLKEVIDAMNTALVNQIKAVNDALSNRIAELETNIKNDSEELHNLIKGLDGKINTINIRLDNHDGQIATINSTLASHVRDYASLRSNYEAFKSYTENKFTSVDNSISALNSSVRLLQEYFTELDDKFDGVENEISRVESILEDSKLLVKELEDRFGDTLAAFEQFKKDVDNKFVDFKDLIGEPGGIAPLDSDAKVPAAYLPSYVDDVLEYATLTSFPLSGETGKIYVAKDTNITYRWSGSTYVEISASLALGETSSTAYPGNKGKQTTDSFNAHITDYDNPHRVTKEQVGLANVDNTRDIDKPLSTAMIEALANKVEVEPGKGLVSLEDANKIQDFTKKIDEFEDTLNSEINRATKAEGAISSELALHKSDNTNPHGVTAAQIGLANVDNTSDLEKPISKATQAAIDAINTTIDEKIGDIDFSIYETIEGAEGKYQPKGNYLTEHQDISGLATKEEVTEAINGVDVTEQLKSYATKEELTEVSESIPTKVSQLTNDANYQTQSQVDERFEQLIGAAPADLDTLEELAAKLQDGDDIHTALIQSISEKASKTELQEATTANALLEKIKTVDGPDSELDAASATKQNVIRKTTLDLDTTFGSEYEGRVFYGPGGSVWTNGPEEMTDGNAKTLIVSNNSTYSSQILILSTGIIYHRVGKLDTPNTWKRIAYKDTKVDKAVNADTVNNYQASPTPGINTVTVTDSRGNLTANAIRIINPPKGEIREAGWYRVYEANNSNSYGDSVILNLLRLYNNLNNEGYQFSITYGYSDKVNITQLSGFYNTRCITKIRVLTKNRAVAYIDVYYNSSTYNDVFVSGMGRGHFLEPTLSNDIPEGYIATEFETTTGFKATDSNYAKIWVGYQSDYDAIEKKDKNTLYCIPEGMG